MPSVNETFPANSGSLRALEDIPKEGRTFLIADVRLVQFDDGPKLSVSFRGEPKRFIVNKTNAQTIAELYGDETDDWIGSRVTLYATKVDFGGKRVDAIRVRDTVPEAPRRPELAAAGAAARGGGSRGRDLPPDASPIDDVDADTPF